MISKVLSFIFSMVFLASLVFITWSIPFFNKPKPIIHVLLLDVSRSMLNNQKYLDESIKKIESCLNEKEYLTRGYFSDKAVFRDETIQEINHNNFIAKLNEWVDGSAPYLGYLNLNTSDPMNAIQNSYEKFSEQGVLHFVILSDCIENRGGIAGYKEYAKNKNISLSIMPLLLKPDDVFLKNLIVPRQITSGHSFDIEMVVLSTSFFDKVSLNLNLQDQNIFSSKVKLQKGENRFLCNTIIEKPGIYDLKGSIDFADKFLENNQLNIQIKTVDNKNVLIVSSENQSALSAFVNEPKFISSMNMPLQIDEYNSYSGVVLENIPWQNLLDSGKISVLSNYVEKGGKLLVVGGNKSFGFGDYMGTPIEKLLPVKINPNGLVSMLVAVDISGSMEGEVRGMRKIDIAINSLVEIAGSLEPKDQLGVHLYNEKRIGKDLWLPLTNSVNFESELNQKIKILPKPTGGTFIIPALETMYENLINNERQLRIAVLISDGETNEKEFDNIFNKFRDAKPPISLICIGADMSDNSPLVQTGKKVFGNSWSPININNQGWVNLKDCFHEAFRKIASGFSDSGEFKIFVNQAHPVSKNIQPFDGILKGTILKTGLKPNASVLLDIDDKLPLVAHRYFGSGEVISFHSGFYDNWSGDWLKSAQGKSFQSMICTWLQQSENSSVYIDIKQEGSNQKIIIHSSLSHMKNYSVLNLHIGDQIYRCIRNGNTTWSSNIDNDLIKESISNAPFILKTEQSENSVFVQDGLMPKFLSNEILDLHYAESGKNDFIYVADQYVKNEDQLKPITIRAMEEKFQMKDFFYIALISFLFALIFRARAT